MSDTPKTEREAMWVTSGTGEDLQCIHIEEAREMERLLIEAKAAFDGWTQSSDWSELEEIAGKIDKYLACEQKG